MWSERSSNSSVVSGAGTLIARLCMNELSASSILTAPNSFRAVDRPRGQLASREWEAFFFIFYSAHVMAARLTTMLASL